MNGQNGKFIRFHREQRLTIIRAVEAWSLAVNYQKGTQATKNPPDVSIKRVLHVDWDESVAENQHRETDFIASSHLVRVESFPSLEMPGPAVVPDLQRTPNSVFITALRVLAKGLDHFRLIGGDCLCGIVSMDRRNYAREPDKSDLRVEGRPDVIAKDLEKLPIIRIGGKMLGEKWVDHAAILLTSCTASPYSCRAEKIPRAQNRKIIDSAVS